MWFSYDVSSDSNSVEFEEFMVGISICCRGTRAEKINVLFHVFDLNEDGFIQKPELVAMLSNFPRMALHMSKCLNIQISEGSCDQSVALDHYPCRLATGSAYESRKDSRGVSSPKMYVDPFYAATPSIKDADTSMGVRKMVHTDTVAFKELVSSLSRLSFQSVVSNESLRKVDVVENSADSMLSSRSVKDRRRLISRGIRSPNLRRSCSASACDRVASSSSRPCADLSPQDKLSDTVDRLSIDSSRPSLGFDSPHSDIDVGKDFCHRRSSLRISSPPVHDLGDTDPIILSHNGRDANVRRCIQGLDEAETYRKSQCDNSPRSLDSPHGSIAAMAIVDEDRLVDVDSIAMDIIVESILEDCEFNDKGSLDLAKFKMWLNKNDSVLTMFSEYMHEEFWGLQGNAFLPSPESHEFFVNSVAGDLRLSSPEFGDDSKGALEVDGQDKVVQRMVYQMFLVNDTEAQAFTECVSSLENVVSEELLQYLHQVSSKMQRKSSLVTGRIRTDDITDTPTSSNVLTKEIFSCPNCGTPFFMCPECFNRHESLSLYVDSGVYIVCDHCESNNRGTRFTSCWICGWTFSEAMQMALIKRRQRDRSQLCNRRPSSIRTSPIRGFRTVSRPSCRILMSDDTPRRRRSMKYASSPSSVTPGVDCRTPQLLATSKDNLLVPLDSLTSPVSCREGGDWPLVHAKLPIKSGYMFKHGRHFHKLKKRYFILIDNLLYYYSDKESTKPSGCLFLEGCYLDSLVRSDQASDMYGLCICHKANKFNRREFYVASRTDFFEWVEALSVAMKQQNLMQLYNICEQIGHGKFSVVYRAIHKSTGEEFAVKIVDKSKIGVQERELLRSEIAILRLLSHKHVIYLKDVSDTCDSLYIVMELVKGGELYDLINQKHRLSEAHTHKIICQLLEIVAYLHKCGIIHRDIKPENILLTDKTESATIKLTDFGLSTLCDPNELLTQPCGTLAYVAPEVLTLQGYNQKADVWSIGVIMFLLLRGRLPFSVKNPANLNMNKHYRVRFEGRHWEGVSTSAKDLITRLLHLNPEKRITVFDALDHIWVKNFVAVNYDESLSVMGSMEATTELIHSLRNTTDTTFVIPYTESCIANLKALQNDAYEPRDEPLGTVEE